MCKVLVVDDSRAIRKIIATGVVAAGGNVVGFAADGEEALNQFKLLLPDLVLLDLTMPNKDGRECLKEILLLNPLSRVVMLSAISAENTIHDCLKMGAEAYLNKALLSNPESLHAELRKFFDKSINKLAA